MECPKCHAECQCDSVHNGVALIYGPYGCPQCGWSENEEYDLSTRKSPVDERGGAIDQFGGYHPPGSLRAILCAGCGGDRGTNEEPSGRWIKCTDCDGDGEIEVEFKPVTMEDLDDAHAKD